MIPRIAGRLVARWVAKNEREFVLGDLEERFHELRNARGSFRARLWYWKQSLLAVLLLRSSPTPDPRPLTPRPRGDGAMRTLWQDLRYGLRMLARSPGFTTVALITLALGIGANTAIFSVVKPILFAPLPYPHGDELVVLGETGEGGPGSTIGFLTVQDIGQRVASLNAVAAVSSWQPTMSGTGEPERLNAQSVTSSYFAVLGVRPALGRNFMPSEDAVGGPRVVMLSNGLWRRRFGGDSSIIGKPVTLSGRSYEVIGVMPLDYENLLNPLAQAWRPLAYDATLPQACRSCRHLRSVARLREGATIEEANRDLAALWPDLVRAWPGQYSGTGLGAASLRAQLSRSVRPALLALLGAAGFVLLIACANVMSLMLARASQRGTEFAIRAALGAGRRRVIRQLLTESVLLAIIGAVAGLVVARVGIVALLALAPAGLPRLDAIRLDSGVMLFTAAVAAIAGVLFGLAPAVAAARSDLHGQLKQDVRRGGEIPRLTRGALVVSEVALAVMLLVGAGLMIRSLHSLMEVRTGYNPDRLLTMQVQASGPQFRNDTTVLNYFGRVLDAVRAVPGVRSADATSQLPLGGDFDGYGVHLMDRPNANPADDPGADRYAVSTGYLSTMGIPLLKGRDFTNADMNGAAVVLINETLAKRAWPGEDPVGKRVRIGDPDNGPWREVVGVVGDVHHVSLDAPQSNQIYHPESQSPYGADNAMTLVIRTRGDPVALAPQVRSAVRSVDADQPIIRIASMDQIVATSAAQRRFILVLFEAFAAVALLLAAAGIYGVLAGTVAERTREIGIRSALGASRGDILGLVVRQGARLTVIGLGLGTAGALALTGTIRGMLFGVGAQDPVSFGAAVALLSLVALAACSVPAWRAARVDPMVALRSE